MNVVMRRSMWLSLLMLAAPARSRAQAHEFAYTIYGDVTRGTDGAPFSNPICSGVLHGDVAFSDVPGRGFPRWTTICPNLDESSTFGAQFRTILHYQGDGFPAFTMVVAGGAEFYRNGTELFGLPGEHAETNRRLIARGSVNDATTPVDYNITLNYYSYQGPSTLSLTFNQGIRSSAPNDPAPGVAPEPASLSLLATGLIGIVAAVRRKQR